LTIASREFLEVFADSVNHIPKHRKNPFFVHLVHVLPDDALVPPLLLLLLDKCVSKTPKAKKVETESIFSLCQTLVNELAPTAQTRAALALLHESEALTAKSRGSADTRIFLQSPM
jgi:U3 small nucleolar RNA-associated protein 10